MIFTISSKIPSRIIDRNTQPRTFTLNTIKRSIMLNRKAAHRILSIEINQVPESIKRQNLNHYTLK